MKRQLLAGVVGLGIALLAAPAAQASTATVSGGDTVRVTGSGSERNTIVVSYALATDTYTVTDTTSNITPSGTCVAVDTRTVTCPGAGIKTIAVNAGNGSDVIALDRLTILPTIESNLDGGGGDDLINGAKGIDDINGGSGRDLIDGHEGADDLNGGSSTDTLFYTDRTTALQVTIGAVNGNDGNELDLTGISRDTVHGDVENVLGGTAGDTIIGDGSSETLVGNDGNDLLVGNKGGDTLLGFAGDDSMFGGDGNDVLRGSLGNDLMLGGPDDDRLAGGADNDFLWGKKGVDVMKGKTGIDVIRAKDGTRDRKINCGPGPNGIENATRDKRLDPKPKSC